MNNTEKNEMQKGRDGSPSRPSEIALPEQKAFFSAKGGSACGGQDSGLSRRSFPTKAGLPADLRAKS